MPVTQILPPAAQSAVENSSESTLASGGQTLPLPRKKSGPTRPWACSTLHLELTNHCNLACSICPHRIMQRKRGVMDTTLALSLLDAARGRCREVDLSFFGEPLLHPQLSTILSSCKRRDYRLTMSTNATMLGPEIRHLIADVHLDMLHIGLDSVFPETYRKIRGHADHATVMSNTRNFLKLTDRGPVCVVLVSMSLNHSEHRAFCDHWKPYLRPGDEILITNFCSWHGAIRDLDEKPSRICPMWNGQVVVGWDGTVSACSLDFEQELAVGTISDLNVFQLDQSRRYRQLWNDYLDSRLEACRHCFDKHRAIVRHTCQDQAAISVAGETP
ncbi:MAG: radical SAM protein [bacterium]